MAMEFEVVSHKLTSFNIFFVNMLYRTPHIHKDFEIGILLSGSLKLIYQDRAIDLKENDLWITNPFQSHEFSAHQPALVLFLQVSPSFFSSYYPQIDNLNFSHEQISIINRNSAHLKELLFEIADLSFRQPPNYEFRAIGQINMLFYHIMRSIPYEIIPEKEKNRTQHKATQMRRIMNYIDSNYSQKLLLSEIADRENLTLSYLSHFFRNSFGMPFQTYLLKMRCEKARKLLLSTNLSLLDICITCGFSDMKYFNRGFQEQYGYSPREYRTSFENEVLEMQQSSMLTTQDILSKNASLAMLAKYQNATH